MSRADFLQLRASRWRYLGLIILLGLYFAQSVAAVPFHSVTFDEQYHLTPGYIYLTQHDLRFHHDQNPPLFEAILTAPLLVRSDIQLPLDHPAYQLWGDVYLFSDAFLWHSGNDPASLAQAGRVMAALTGVLLGLLLFVWGKQLFGEAAGWIALFLFAFDPNFIANAIPTLDLPLAFTYMLALFALWHYLKRPTALMLILTGLALGFALATKFLSVMLLPGFFLVLLVYPFSSSLLKRLLAFGVMLLLAYLVIWATYLFQFGPIHGAGLPVPAPQYFESFMGMFFKSSEGRANYLLGQVSTTGWWYYFVVAFFLKTPLPTIGAILLALVRWPWRKEWRTSSILYLPALVFFSAASISQLQLGYRYILPVLPLLFLMAGRVGHVILSPAGTKNLSSARTKFLAAPRLGMTLLAAWLVVSAIVTFPNHLSYFNELVGGANNGYQYLTDSNVDWGQDLPALKNWIDRRQPDRLHLAFFGSAYPDRYGVNAIGIPGYPNSAFGREADAFTSYSL
ncbi:MAG TPA: glycosyltransferase family 39 protein, partial [Anaerolineae bacterium]|nr:glycosyltransferase family 39 protein [Anaerolineae bacterium]